MAASASRPIAAPALGSGERRKRLHRGPHGNHHARRHAGQHHREPSPRRLRTGFRLAGRARPIAPCRLPFPPPSRARRASGADAGCGERSEQGAKQCVAQNVAEQVVRAGFHGLFLFIYRSRPRGLTWRQALARVPFCRAARLRRRLVEAGFRRMPVNFGLRYGMRRSNGIGQAGIGQAGALPHWCYSNLG